jgi:hypothetical protein
MIKCVEQTIWCHESGFVKYSAGFTIYVFCRG